MLELFQNWWCHKVLPLVYTDALSYYEVLGKLIQKLNETIANVNSLNENTVFTVNNIKPTSGNVDVGTVKSVNGSTPDESGNVSLPQVSGVTSVDGVGADASGNVPLNAVKTVNNISPTAGNVNVGTVKQVNGTAPDSDGNVNVGTVKSINTQFKPDAAGNVYLSAAGVGAIPNTSGSVNGNNILNEAITIDKLAANAKGYTLGFIDTSNKIQLTDEHKCLYLGDNISAVLDTDMLTAAASGWSCMIICAGDGVTLTKTGTAYFFDLENHVMFSDGAINITNIGYLYIHKLNDLYWFAYGSGIQKN